MSGRRVAGLYFLADADPRWALGPVEQARAALAGGATVVQLRAKRATDREILAWGTSIRALCREHAALFFVNDRFDLALACEADGVHLGQDDLPPARIPDTARRRLLVGRSTHTVEQARVACGEPIDYLAFGPLFGTTSKDSPYSARGLAALREIVAIASARPVVAIGDERPVVAIGDERPVVAIGDERPVVAIGDERPVVAIGGIDASSAGSAIEAGAAAVCVISAIAAATDPERAAREIAAAVAAARVLRVPAGGAPV